VEALERRDVLIRAAPQADGGAQIAPEAYASLGWTPQEAELILRALDFAPVHKARPGEAVIWRRRREKSAPAPVAPAASPFAALAALTPPPTPARRPRRRRARTRRAAPGGA
jgi:ATP-dependent RNA helicase SUPV3L1/SUV3